MLRVIHYGAGGAEQGRLKSKYSHIVVLVSAILAFVPVMGVGHLLDGYVRMRETAKLQAGINAVTAQIQNSVYDAMNGIEKILVESPSLCTSTFLANARQEMGKSLYLRQLLVEEANGAQLCDVYGSNFSYTALSRALPIPGHPEKMTIVKAKGLNLPLIKISQDVGRSRTISAFVPLSPGAMRGVPPELGQARFMRVALPDGVPVLTKGDPVSYDRRSSDAAFIGGEALAGDIPLSVSAAVPFSVVRGDYADLDFVLTIVACLMSGGFLALALHFVRMSQLPSFDLERAIANGELQPYYQPVIDLNTGRVAGCEVLVRWVKKNGEVVPPGAFIDYAEISGLAIPMTLSLMQQVRNDLSELSQEVPGLKISINLFAGHFLDGTVVEDVQAIFGDSPIDFRQLVFEITERRPLGSALHASSVIAGLHSLGARLAMDDVGTGHSNLAYLQTLGVDIIKIDRVFIDMIKKRDVPAPVLEGLITMGRDLGAELIAEGVETKDQALYLRDHGVVMAQGFLFSRAIRKDAYVQLARALNGVDKGGDAPDRAAA